MKFLLKVAILLSTLVLATVISAAVIKELIT